MAKVVALVQARMGSTRLPGKVLKEVMGRPLLSYLVERLRRVPQIDEIVIATTTNPEDQAIVTLCQKEKISCFRGSAEDVLDRLYRAAKQFEADIVIRITADCPLIDPVCIQQALALYLDEKPDYVSNAHVRSFPIGMDVEVFSFSSLQEAHQEAKKPEEREHVTPFIYRHPERYCSKVITHTPDLSHLRLTVDTAEDLALITKLLELLYPIKHNFTLQDILSALKSHPDWLQLNAHVPHKHLENFQE